MVFFDYLFLYKDPVLFSGTLRYNLDPFGHHSDADIWFALGHSHLHELVSKQVPGGLDHRLSKGGQNINCFAGNGNIAKWDVLGNLLSEKISLSSPSPLRYPMEKKCYENFPYAFPIHFL
jgi:hypothetical protein